MKRLFCRLFGHRVIGDNFHGHYCARCEEWFDWGILEEYRKPLPYGTVIKIPKFRPITKEDLLK